MSGFEPALRSFQVYTGFGGGKAGFYSSSLQLGCLYPGCPGSRSSDHHECDRSYHPWSRSRLAESSRCATALILTSDLW